jgi:NodT family efflux transporter outer membrane factor (OMF) lipoprotein
MKLYFLKRATPLLSALILAGCVSYAGITPQAKLTSTADLHLADTRTQWPDLRSWEILHDPVLNQLMDQALEGNPSIKVAQARLNKVSAMTQYANANRYPEVGVRASVTPERFTENGLYPPPYAGATKSTNLLMVNAQYEFDFWGKNHDLLAAAISQEKAAQAEVHASRLLIETSVAKSYFSLANNLEQKAILEKMLTVREELSNVASRRLEAGLETSQDRDTTQQGIPAMKAFISAIDEQITLSRNALAALIGKGPDATQNVLASLPASLKLPVPESVSANLLGHRADITAARLRAEAAAKQIDAGKTEFYPNINLSAFAGLSSIGFTRWLDSSSRDYGVGPAISLPIFDGGRLRADLSSKTAEYDLAVESYNQTLIEAVHDVADQLTSLKAIAVQQQQQNELLHSAETIYQNAVQREQAGLVNRITVLNAQTSVLNQQSIATELRTRAVGFNINLLRALGGGFDEQAAYQAKVAQSATPNTAARGN